MADRYIKITKEQGYKTMPRKKYIRDDNTYGMHIQIVRFFQNGDLFAHDLKEMIRHKHKNDQKALMALSANGYSILNDIINIIAKNDPVNPQDRIDLFNFTANLLEPEQKTKLAQQVTRQGSTLLMQAADNGNLTVFKTVFKFCYEALGAEKTFRLMTETYNKGNQRGRNIMHIARLTCEPDLYEEVINSAKTLYQETDDIQTFEEIFKQKELGKFNKKYNRYERSRLFNEITKTTKNPDVNKEIDSITQGAVNFFEKKSHEQLKNKDDTRMQKLLQRLQKEALEKQANQRHPNAIDARDFEETQLRIARDKQTQGKLAAAQSLLLARKAIASASKTSQGSFKR